MAFVDHTILITGGATGIGFALAGHLLRAGNRVIVCGRRQDALDRAVAALPGLIALRCDVTDAGERAALVATLERDFPALDVLINNAGIQRRVDFAARSTDGETDDTADDAADIATEITAEIATNLTAPVQLVSALIPLLSRQPAATIVNVTSGLAFCPFAAAPVYSATKAALHAFTLCLRHQLLGGAVRVVELAPPIVATGLDAAGARDADAGPPAMSADAFADAAVEGLGRGDEEVIVGLAKNLRAAGEAMFSAINC